MRHESNKDWELGKETKLYLQFLLVNYVQKLFYSCTCILPDYSMVSIFKKYGTFSMWSKKGTKIWIAL